MLNLLLGLNLDYKCKAFPNLNEIMCKLQRMKFMGDFQYLVCRKSDCCIISFKIKGSDWRSNILEPVF